MRAAPVRATSRVTPLVPTHGSHPAYGVSMVANASLPQVKPLIG